MKSVMGLAPALRSVSPHGAGGQQRTIPDAVIAHRDGVSVLVNNQCLCIDERRVRLRLDLGRGLPSALSATTAAASGLP
jgi:hypothetical protein